MHPHLLLTIYPATDTRTLQQLLTSKGYALYQLDEASMGINPIGSLPTETQAPFDVLATTLHPEELQKQLQSL